MTQFQCVLFVLLLSSRLTFSENIVDSAENTLNFVNEARIQLNITENSNLILVMGRTGVGKSTLVHCIAGDLSKLVSKVPSNTNSKSFQIHDELDPNAGTVTSSTESRTFVPEIIVDEEQNKFCDCPGFQDTRNETVEIATAFLIKSVIESAKIIKFVLVEDYESVTKGHDRKNFDELLARTVELLKNVTQFENSVSLVVTKVRPVEIWYDELINVTEDSVKNTTAEFINEHRGFLQKKGSSERKIQLIDALLEQSSNDDYSKISIFWRPNRPGPFNTIAKMVEGRRSIRKSILEHSTFVDIQSNVFGFPLSPQAQLQIKSMTQHSKNIISSTLQNVNDHLLLDIQRQFESVTSFKKRLQLIDLGENRIEGEAFTLKQTSEQLIRLIKAFNVTSIDTMQFNQIESYESNLNTLESLNGSEMNASKINYNSFMKEIIDFFKEYRIETQTNISTKARETIRNISNILMIIDGKLTVALRKQLLTIDSFQKKFEYLRLLQGCIGSSRARDISTLKKRIEQFNNLTNTFDITSICINDLIRIEKHEKILSALKSMAQDEIVIPTRDWIERDSSSAITYLIENYKWYSFLVETYRYFAGYDVQKNVKIYNVANLSDWGQFNKSQGLVIDETNFNGFVSRMKRDTEFDSCSSRFDELNGIINSTLKESIKFQCDNELMVIKGNFVKSSDINEKFMECPSKRTLKKIHVYVSDTFYVNCDLFLNKTIEVELQIFAPTWNVQEAATFYLNGIDGEPHPRLEYDGRAGKRGNMGTHAGNFFGVANDVFNIEQLTIELNGGNGGNGQDGTGSPDATVSFDRTTHDGKGSIDPRNTDPDNYYRRFFRENGYDAELKDSKINTYFYVLFAQTNIFHSFRLYSNGCCGKTGVGGYGGLGGKSGQSSFLYTKAAFFSEEYLNYQPKIKRSDGSDGVKGQTAKVCESLALDLKIDTHLDEAPAFWSFYSKFHSKNYIHNPRCSSSGDYAFDNTIISIPKYSNEEVHVAEAIVEYKKFLLESMNNPILVDGIRKAYDILDSSYLYVFYSTKSFAMEARILEEQYFKLNQHVNILPLYDNLLKRLENVTKMGSLSEVDRKVFALLYTTLKSKTTSVRTDHNSDLIIDIENFLDLIIKNIAKLDESGRIYVINEQCNVYNDGIMAKINEANDYIENDIKLEIETNFATLHIEMQKTVNETISCQVKTIKDIQKKEANTIIIRRNAVTRSMLKVVGFVSNIFAVVHQLFVKSIATIAYGVTNEMSKNLNDPVIERTQTSELPLSIQRLRSKAAGDYQMKIDIIENELTDLMDSLKEINFEMPKFCNELSNLISKVTIIKSEKSFEPYKISHLLNECIDFLGEWKRIFIITSNELNMKVSRLLQKKANSLAVTASSTTCYQDFANDGQGLDEIGEAINDDHETLIAFMRFEDEIYAELMPLIDTLHENIVNTEGDLANKSSVALNVIRWKFGVSFRKVQKRLNDAVDRFETEYATKNCLVGISEAINLMIDIFDRQHHYQEDLKFASYLSGLQTANYQNLDIDSQTQNEINTLQMHLRGNLILGQYYRAIDAFKQTIFPYAAEYLDAYDWPNSLNDDSFDHVMMIVTNKIKTLSEKIREYNTTVINENDMFIHVAHFNNERGSKGPFYVWKNDEVRDKINQLFDGRRVHLYADVTKSNPRNAVKFNIIDLEFRAKNQNVTNQLAEILQEFHVTLTHMGESNYRCNDDFYTISSRPLTIEFSFGEKNQAPTDRNNVYDKLSAGIKLLSPYTLWAIQLSRGPFEKIKPFIDFVDIELHGYGQYVRENATICESNLEKYYIPKNKLALTENTGGAFRSINGPESLVRMNSTLTVA
ncbi:uncharacterized protein LOC129573302 [Sitodiplosis mosellana]|uniref:uncharacterized protein LOC129573302 n=1 Tax=Sitodiplosis mosellana TaxID=263140 RepID=UPI0024437446|nr:uncharacterized protein LOC129573302 [Sitodiplosis mosellana]